MNVINYYTILVFSLSFSFQILAQTDSLKIDLAQLTWQDIQQESQISLKRQVSSASRSLQDIQELPFSIYVISGDEIRQNGYITLVDALKMLPGIRISQPGSAIEGELFMMRGLIGNTYTKILINGIPIKPYMVNGMPIGAQLPIQQASRIEVIYGPAAALYGADATAGIINIVLEDSDRPIYTNASLHIGDNGYSSLNIDLGGKLGKGDRVLKFRVFGSNTRLADRRIIYDREVLYNPTSYALGSGERLEELEQNANFRGTVTSPIINELPHQSRSFGFDLNYKIFHLSFKNMHRQDHSALGLNPLAVSYANPLTSIGEDIMEANLTVKKQYENFGFQTTIGLLNYELDNRSSTIYLNPTLDFVFDSLAQLTSQPEVVLERVHNNFFNRTRFSFSNSLEYYAEQTFNFKVLEKGTFTTGLRFQRGDGQPFIDFQPTPIQSDNIRVNNLRGVFTDPSYTEISGFGQLFLPLDKWNILLGGQYLVRNNPEYTSEIRAFNPRIALLYKASNKVFLRASYSTAFKIPSPYLNATTYTVRPDNFDAITTGVTRLDSEQTFSYELGLRWLISPKAEWDINAFYTRTTDFVTYDFLPNPRDSAGLTLGFFNSPNTLMQLTGVQSMLNLRDIVSSWKLDAQISLSYAKGREDFFPFEQGIFREHISGINSVRAYPEFIGQARVSLSPIPKMRLTFDNIFISSSITRNIILIESTVEDTNGDTNLSNKGFHTLDIAVNYQLTPSFSIYGKILNALDTQYAGIDGYNSPDILLFNPQSLRIYRLGVNYNFGLR